MLDPVCLNVRVCCIYVYVCMFVCKYQRVFATLVYLHISDYDCPFRRICRRLAPNYSLTFTHTHKGKHTRAHVFRADTLTHTRLIIISSCYSVTLPPLLLLTSQEYAVAYASLFRWFFMLLLRLVYGLHYMPYHALTVINAHSRAYFARFGRAGEAGQGKSKRFLLYIHRDSHMFIMLNLCAFVVFGFYIALSGDALNDALM